MTIYNNSTFTNEALINTVKPGDIRLAFPHKIFLCLKKQLTDEGGVRVTWIDDRMYCFTSHYSPQDLAPRLLP